MAICSNCGHYVHEGMTQCDVCGTPVAQTLAGTPPPVQPQMTPPPVQPQMAPPVQQPVAPPVQQGAPPPVPSAKPSMPSIPSIPSVEGVKGEVRRVATQAAQQVASNAGIGSIPSIPSIQSIPSIPSVGSIEAMATGGVKQAATQVVQQFTNGIDLTMSNVPGLMITQRWTQTLSPVGGAVGAVASQAKKWTRNKLSWFWFLIPLITIIIYLINLATK